jgi:hypothetical protein
MLFKSVLGIQYEFEVPLDATFHEITNLFDQKYDSIVYVVSGHTISLDSTPEKEKLTNDSVVFIVTREARTPTPTPKHPDADLDSDPPSLQEQETVLNQTHGNSLGDLSVSSEPLAEGGAGAATTLAPVPDPLPLPYQVSYNGQQVKTAMKKSSNIMLNLIHMIGHQNPFFLSYLAVNPTKAKEHIEETLNQPDFTIVIKGDSVSDDPIRPYLMHPNGDGWQIDQSNLDYILEQCPDYVVTDESRSWAKDLYLLLDRDIRKTIRTLQNPSESLSMLAG